MSVRLLSFNFFFVLGLIFTAMIAEAKKVPSKVYDLPDLVAIQDRDYYLSHDLTFNVGWLPSDAFNKYAVGGVSYTYFLEDYMAWEVVNVQYSFLFETDLKGALEENFPLEVENVGFQGFLDPITFVATTAFLYTPMYNKSLLFNSSLFRSETSFLVQAGIANFKRNETRPLFGAGFIFRVLLSEDQSLKFDFRQSFYLEADRGLTSLMSLMVGYSFQLGEGPEQ